MAKPTVARSSARRARVLLVLGVAERLLAAGVRRPFWRDAIKRLRAKLADLPEDPPEPAQVRRRGKAKTKAG